MSATTDPGNRSAAEIEADVEQTRVRVAQTIDALRDSMSPGQIMDQVVDYARTSGGAEFTRNLGAQVRDNPLPVLLIGAGIGWLLLSNGNKTVEMAGPVPPQRMLPPPAPPSPSTRMHVVHQSSGPGMMERAAQTGAAVRDGVEQTASSVGSTIGQAASSVGGAISSAASAVGGAISSAASSASQAASSAAGSVSHAASSAAGSVSGMAGSATSAMGSVHDSARAYGHDATHAASHGMHVAAGGVNQFGQQIGGMGDQLRHSWNRASSEQPLLLGALGLALGAVVGALLPRTRTEDRLMGEASDAVTQQLTSAAQEQYEQAKEVVSERVGEVREKLGDSAPSVSSIGDAVVGAAAGVREAVGQTARDLGDSAKAGLDKQEEAVTGQKSDDSKTADAKPGDYKPAGSGTFGTKPGETKPADDKFVAKPDKPMQTI